jgi:uncharacterized linocin/CFP29 family protein
MNGNSGNAAVDWPDEVWQGIANAVAKEVAKVRTAQKVFPTVALADSPTEIPDDVIDFRNLSIQEGSTKPFVELYQEFPLTSTQVGRETKDKTCQTLSRMAAKALALVEDAIIFQGRAASLGDVEADQIGSAANGLLGAADPRNADDANPRRVSVPIDIDPLKPPRPGLVYGENVFSAVVAGIAKLVSKGQAPMFALFLPTRVYADSFVPPSNASLATTAERIKPLVEGGFYGTGTLPDNRGLLVALAGDPTGLYVGREATTEFLRKERRQYIFRVAERIQFVVRDPRAFVLLRFN